MRPLLLIPLLAALLAPVVPSAGSSAPAAPATTLQDPAPEEEPLADLRAAIDAARAAQAAGEAARARKLVASAAEDAARALAEDDSEALADLCHELGSFAHHAGELRAAERIRRAVLEQRERTLPADHPKLLGARQNLASTMYQMGDYQGARSLFEAVLEASERTLPADHPELLKTRGNLAVTMYQTGDLHGARAFFEAVLAARERSLPSDHPALLSARGNLAGTVRALGDLSGARALQEAVLGARERTLPEDHPDLLRARGNLAVTMRQMGDLQGARALEEAVLEARERTYPEDHPNLLRARGNLAATMYQMDDLQGARTLQERVLEACERTLPDDHPDLLRARSNLAATMLEMGDLSGARAHFEAVLEADARSLPAEHPHVLSARANLALTCAWGASLATSGEEQVEQWWSRARSLAGEAARGAEREVRAALLGSSSREAEERVARVTEIPLDQALSFTLGFGVLGAAEELATAAFRLSETGRGAGLAAARLAWAARASAEYATLRDEARAASADLAALAQGGASVDEFHAARTRREAAEQGLLGLARQLAGDGFAGLEVEVGTLAARLEAGEGLVAFRLYTRSWLEPLEGGADDGGPALKPRARESLGAFVLARSDDDEEPRLAFVDLGAADDLESIASEWRTAIRATPERGLGVPDAGEDPALALGRRLRAAVWDPLLAALGDAERVVVCLDDVLHLVPLDALPLDGGDELVGDRWRIETRLALWELLDALAPLGGASALVSLGGASFNSEPTALGARDLAALTLEEDLQPADAGALAIALLRGGAWERGFGPLPYTRSEAQGLAELFDEVFDGEAPALVLDRRRASREALAEAAPRARFLHVATHGWFAPESVRSWADRDASAGADVLAPRADADEVVRGMSPMLLCGLALAGANLPADSLGRVPGLMTAEELSTLDLTSCELAVLSACDTNVGERRAGQGVASLQKALHMAGARSVITSLWKVPDEATAELMLDFYRRLWVEQKPKQQALWEAKQRLRDARDESGRLLYTTRDWAAWVLTGDPN